MSQKFKRRNYFIKKDFQGRLILGFFLFVVGSVILFAVILGMFSVNSMTMSYENNSLQLGQTPIMLFKKALAANWIFLIFGGSLLVLAALFFSHHIAGPQFRFEKALQNMISGNLNDMIHLRDHDEGTSLATRINTFNRELSRKIREIDLESRSIDELIRLLEEDGADPVEKEYLLEKIHSIRTHNDAIRQVAASYTLVDE